jgi:uncharacterized protein (DUF1501 family)
MQSSVPELTDVSGESENTYSLYGEDARKPGTFAHSCLMARRLVERDVRFVQLYQRGWDVHGLLPQVLPSQCKDIDQACYGLVQDLKQRGMLDDTLVVCGGEFGRTIYCQGKLTKETYGRDHHPRCFSLWLAGGGVKGGVVHGATDELGFHAVENRHYLTDVHATVLHQMGLDPRRLEVPGRKRLDVDFGKPIREILA